MRSYNIISSYICHMLVGRCKKRSTETVKGMYSTSFLSPGKHKIDMSLFLMTFLAT